MINNRNFFKYTNNLIVYKIISNLINKVSNLEYIIINFFYLIIYFL